MNPDADLIAELLAQGCTQDQIDDLLELRCELQGPESINSAMSTAALLMLVCQGLGGGGGDALVADPLSQFAATTSAQFLGVISDETGTGLVMGNNSPTITTPALTLAQSAAPTPTVEGVIEWDTNDDRLAIGDGAATRIISPDDVAATLTNKTVASGSNTLVASVVNTAVTGTVADTDCYGSVHYLTGAITMTLPAAVEGMHITFVSTDATVKAINPDGTDQFILNGTALTAGNEVDSPGAAGDNITFHASAANEWTSLGSVGTWVDGGA